MKDRTATYTVKIPITFTFTAMANTENEKIYKMAQAYFDMRLGSGMIDYDEKDIAITKKLNYTQEEREALNAYWKEVLNLNKR